MIALLILFIVFTCVFGYLAVFFGSELRKKFGFMRQFVENSDKLVIWYYPGAKEFGQPRGMRNIVLRSEQKFHVLVGFKLTLADNTGFDYYGYVASNKHGVAVIRTFLGTGDCEFQFLMKKWSITENPIMVTSNDTDQALKPDVVFPPHWFQRLGFFG